MRVGRETLEKEGCIRCYQCEWYCPDIAIAVIEDKEKENLKAIQTGYDLNLYED